jgi:hypothetical protein
MAGSPYRRWAGRQKRNTRSGIEKQILNELDEKGIKYKYESLKFTYVTTHTYTPDVILDNGIVIEIKGYFTADDRKKLLKVKELYPSLDLRLVFGANNKIHKMSSTRYSDWCEKHGFPYAIKHIPEEWLKEPPRPIPKTFKVKTLLNDIKPR